MCVFQPRHVIVAPAIFVTGTVNRKELQSLAEARLKDAQTLFDHGRFDGAYYLAGYAIECALKACIAKKTKRHDFPDKDFAHNVYTHDVSTLLRLSGLESELRSQFRTEPKLEARWGVVKGWNEKSRYGKQGRKTGHDAVAHPEGVLACLRRFW